MMAILASKGEFEDVPDLRQAMAPGEDEEEQFVFCTQAGIWLLRKIDAYIRDCGPLPTNALGLPGSGAASMASIAEVLEIVDLYYRPRKPLVYKLQA
jgi:hypothetical protein